MHHRLGLYRCGGGELMGQRKSALPIGALPITPRQALPIAPLSQQNEALRDANDAVLAVLARIDQVQRGSNETLLAVIEYARATRAAKTGPATQKHQQKAAERNAKIRDAWMAGMDQRALKGLKPAFGKVDQSVAKQFDVDTRTVRRRTKDLRHKYEK
jgi:hypothetical protein